MKTLLKTAGIKDYIEKETQDQDELYGGKQRSREQEKRTRQRRLSGLGGAVAGGLLSHHLSGTRAKSLDGVADRALGAGLGAHLGLGAARYLHGADLKKDKGEPEGES